MSAAPKQKLDSRPRPTRGRGGPYRAGMVLLGQRVAWVVLDAQISDRHGLRYPWRLLIGRVSSEERDKLLAAGAQAVFWSWDRGRKRR